MEKSKRRTLERAGWRVGSADEFLGLSPEETALVETRLLLSASLKQRRIRQRLTQSQLARMLQSSQSRVAKMEAGDPSVSIDLLVRGLFALGASRREVGATIAERRQAAAG